MYILKELYEKTKAEIKRKKIIIIANVRDKTNKYKNLNLNMANSIEFFSIDEFDDIAKGFKKMEYYTKVYYNELAFIEAILSGELDPNEILVINFARNGSKEGKKSLIPCFCDLLNIKYSCTDAFTQSLCRNKFIWGEVLANNNLPVPKNYRYSLEHKWSEITNNLKDDNKYIIKPICESSSMGVGKAMSKKELQKVFENFNHDCIIQTYLCGNEYELPFFELNDVYYFLPPQKILYKGTILNESLSSENDYCYVDSDLSKEQNDYLLDVALQIAKILNIKKYGRIDFKLDKEGHPFVIDIATLPYLTNNSSFSHAMSQMGETYESIYEILLTITYLHN